MLKLIPCFYRDTVSGVDGTGYITLLGFNQEQVYFDYHFSNQNTYDWLAKIKLPILYQGGPNVIMAGETTAINFMTADLGEKTLSYGHDNTGNTLGKVTTMTDYNQDGKIIQEVNLTYDTEGNVATELTEF